MGLANLLSLFSARVLNSPLLQSLEVEIHFTFLFLHFFPFFFTKYTYSMWIIFMLQFYNHHHYLFFLLLIWKVVHKFMNHKRSVCIFLLHNFFLVCQLFQTCLTPPTPPLPSPTQNKKMKTQLNEWQKKLLKVD